MQHKQTTESSVKGKSESVRRSALLIDEWIVYGSVQPTSVQCGGCKKTRQLDKFKNRTYMCGNWFTHKAVCPGIKQGEKRWEAEEKKTMAMAAKMKSGISGGWDFQGINWVTKW